MARGGGTRRPRQDENAHKLEVDSMEIEEAVKRSKPSPPCPGEVSAGKGKSSRKSSRRRTKGKKNSTKGDEEGMAKTVLHPIDVNVNVSPPTPGPAITALQKRKAALEINNQDNTSQSNAGPSEGESSPSGPESPKEDRQPVIWSNAAFCSEHGLQQPLDAASSAQTTAALKKAQLEGSAPLEEVNEELKQRNPSLGKGKHTVHFVEEEVAEQQGPGTAEDDEAEEIEKEIAVLSKRLAELRAKREARYLSQQRAKRALSCPPTPISSKENCDKTPTTEARSRKGWMVSAKFLQFQTKTPAGDKSGDVVAGLPHRRSLGLDQKENGWLAGSSKKAETTPRTGCSKVTEKPARILKKTELRESLDECVINQMKNLSLGTPNNSSSSSRNPLSSIKSFDWSKSLRRSSVIERSADKKLPFDEAAKKKYLGDAKPSLEAQLLVSLKETKAATSKQSPAVTRRVRNVASRYTESPPVQLSSRKRSLDDPSPFQAQQQAAATTATRKRASLEQGSLSSGLKTPTKLVGVRKDGLEQERKRLPKIVAVQRGEHSPRDSGCIKRPHSANRTNFFSTGGQWDGSSLAIAAAAAAAAD